jgi:hypothetical protein
LLPATRPAPDAFRCMTDDKLKALRRENRDVAYREAWEALALIREAIEEHGGMVQAGEYVTPPTMYGEAEALIRSIDRIATRPRRKAQERRGRPRRQNYPSPLSAPLS